MKTYYPTINLLRGIAALMVCIFHFIDYNDFRGSLFGGSSIISDFGKLGTNGVYIFFVISGFVIPLSLAKDNFNLKHLPHFLSRRFLRIEIPYIVSIFLILFVAFAFALKNNMDYSINFQQFLFHILYVIPFSNFEWYNVIYWTLAIEFQFYFTIAFIYYFLSFANQKIIYFTLFLFSLSSFFIQDNRFIFHYSTIFSQGIILFLIKTNRIKAVIGFVLLGLCAIATVYTHSLEIAIFSLLTVLVIHSVEINNKLIKLFGDVSYSLYLTHGLIGGNILYLFSRYVNSFWEKILLVIIALMVSLIFSYIFWWLIENPSRKLSKKVSVA